MMPGYADFEIALSSVRGKHREDVIQEAATHIVYLLFANASVGLWHFDTISCLIQANENLLLV